MWLSSRYYFPLTVHDWETLCRICPQSRRGEDLSRKVTLLEYFIFPHQTLELLTGTQGLVICVVCRMPAFSTHISSMPPVKVLRQDPNVPPLSFRCLCQSILLTPLGVWTKESRKHKQHGVNSTRSSLPSTYTYKYTYTLHPRSVAQLLSWCPLSYHEGKTDRKASPWLCFAILGKPVVPLVKKMAIGSRVFDLIQVWTGDSDLQRDSIQKDRSHVSCFSILWGSKRSNVSLGVKKLGFATPSIRHQTKFMGDLDRWTDISSF